MRQSRAAILIVIVCIIPINAVYAEDIPTNEDMMEMPDVVASTVGVGVYVNTLNLSAGPMLSIWPLIDFGIQAAYGVGTFTTEEVRGLYRLNISNDHNFYFGAGYLRVEKEATVLDVDTKISGDGFSLIGGMERAVFKKKQGKKRDLMFFIEFAKPYIDLEKEVATSEGKKKVSIDYRPFTINTGIIYYPW